MKLHYLAITAVTGLALAATASNARADGVPASAAPSTGATVTSAPVSYGGSGCTTCGQSGKLGLGRFGFFGKHAHSAHSAPPPSTVFGGGVHKQKLPVFQAAPWYNYWPYDAHFLAPAPISGPFYGPPVTGNFPVNPYFPGPAGAYGYGAGYGFGQGIPGGPPPAPMPGGR